MKETKRMLQVAELIKRNFGIVLQAEGSYIYGTEPFVTVTNVKMSPDLGIAKIYISIYNIEDKYNVILQMEEEMARLRSALYHRIRKHLRKMPDLKFIVFCLLFSSSESLIQSSFHSLRFGSTLSSLRASTSNHHDHRNEIPIQTEGSGYR